MNLKKKKVFLTLINFAMTLTKSQGLPVMKMCGVYNRYGRVFQFSGWKKYSLMNPTHNGKNCVQIYS